MAGEERKRRLLRQWWLRTFASAPRRESTGLLHWGADAILLLSRDRELLHANEHESFRESRRSHRWEEMMRGEGSGPRRSSFLSERSVLEDESHGRLGDWKLRCSPDTFSSLKTTAADVKDQLRKCTRSFELRAECSRRCILERMKRSERWLGVPKNSGAPVVEGSSLRVKRRRRLKKCKGRSLDEDEGSTRRDDVFRSETVGLQRVQSCGRLESQLRRAESVTRRASEGKEVHTRLEAASRIPSTTSTCKSDSELLRSASQDERARDEAGRKIVMFIRRQRHRLAAMKDAEKNETGDASSSLRWQEIDELLDQEGTKEELEKMERRVQDLDLFSMRDKHAHNNFLRLARLCLDDWERYIRSENSYKTVENMAKVALQDWTKGKRDNAADILQQAKGCLEQAQELANEVQLSALRSSLEKINEIRSACPFLCPASFFSCRQQSMRNLSVYLAMEETDDISRQYVRSRS
eukprot:758524-Hanusia_phi.AAC.6